MKNYAEHVQRIQNVTYKVLNRKKQTTLKQLISLCINEKYAYETIVIPIVIHHKLSRIAQKLTPYRFKGDYAILDFFNEMLPKLTNCKAINFKEQIQSWMKFEETNKINANFCNILDKAYLVINKNNSISFFFTSIYDGSRNFSLQKETVKNYYSNPIIIDNDNIYSYFDKKNNIYELDLLNEYAKYKCLREPDKNEKQQLKIIKQNIANKYFKNPFYKFILKNLIL